MNDTVQCTIENVSQIFPREQCALHLTKCETIIESIPTIKSHHVQFEDAYEEKDFDKAKELSIVIEKVLQRRSVILDSRKDT